MKYIKRVFIVLFGLLIIMLLKQVKAATSATVYTGEAVSIEKIDSVEITSNNVEIDINTSKVENQFIIKNTKDEELVTKVTAKLEDEKSGFTIRDLVIKVNNLEIKNIEKEKDNYNFYVKIKPNEYEKIELNYTTENDLKNAKVLKYNLDNFKGKKVKKFNIDVKIPEEDVPLVKKIYPECFEYADNDINVKYYDFTVNNLTKDFIIEKETYKNLNYGEELEKDELQSALYKNAVELIRSDLDIKWDRYIEFSVGNGLSDYNREEFATGNYNGEGIVEKKGENEFIEYFNFQSSQWLADYLNIKIGKEYYDTPEIYNSILGFIIYKQANNDDIKRIKNSCIAKYKGSYPLTKEIIHKYNYSNIEGNLINKKIGIDLVESEGDKELYVETNKITGEPEKSIYKKFEEIDILKKTESCSDEGHSDFYRYKYTYKIINIGLDINGNKIDVAEEEKVDYVNKIGVDLYIRKVIYDGNVKTMVKSQHSGEQFETTADMVCAYYNDKNKEIINEYIDDNININTKVVKFDNEIVSNNSKVPTIVSSVGYRTSEKGRYVICYFRFGDEKRLGNIYDAISTKSAKSLIQSNNEDNENTKKNVEDEISNIKIPDDTEEFNINKKEEIKENPIQEVTQETGFKLNLNNTEIIIICILSGAILLNIIIIVVNKKRKKK